MRAVLLPICLVAAVTAAAGESSGPVLYQGFEDGHFFANLTKNGYTSAPNGPGGVWAAFNDPESLTRTREQAAVGDWSVKVIRGNPPKSSLLGVARQAVKPPFEVELWMLRGPKGAASVIPFCLDSENPDKPFQPVRFLCSQNGRLLLYDAESDRYLPTDVSAPEGSWMQLKFRFTGQTCAVTIAIEGEEKALGVVPSLQLASRGIERLKVAPAVSPSGSAVYIDEISFTALTLTEEK